jgi:hypothetical protein
MAMTTAEKLTRLNELRALNGGKKPVESWEQSSARLDEAIAAEEASLMGERKKAADSRRIELAAKIRKSCERDLDDLARMHVEQTGEDYYTAYAEVCGTPLGKRLLRTHDEAYEMQVGR